MGNTEIIFKKEFRSYFNSLTAYIVIVLFLLITGYFFVSPLFIMNQATIRHFVDMMPLLMLFFVPAVTMKSFAEEMKFGTLEILATQPVEDYEIILGKYASAVAFVFTGFLFTLFYPLTLILISRIDIGQVIAQYIGIFLLVSFYASIGIFSSILTKNQVVAFIVSFVICFAFFVIGKLSQIAPPFLIGVIDFIGIDSHFENISRGVLDTRDFIYFLSISFFFLFSTLGLFKSKR